LLDLNFENNLQPKQGYLLVAEPFMDSDYFKRSVILICEYNAEGSFGFVLNNYLDINFEDFSEELIKIDSRISIGGPVDVKNLFYIHTLGEKIPNSIKVSDKIFIGGDYEVLIEQLKSTPNPETKVRFFLGYSGWSKNQLDDEIAEKSWIVVKSDMTNLIMDTSKNNLWQKCLQELGGKYKMFSQIPVNPNNN
jgi:putative transcriptional regulator|tara:strand:+ start:29274 stop:29852 length:579 start_codon:yes stop_codon:yes gene_type:complete